MYVLLLVFTQGWSPPINLGITGFDDYNPQACRIQLFSTTCLVWETNINGNYEIFSRFGTNTFWTDTFRVTNNPLNDCKPAVTVDLNRNCYWCAWQRDSLDNTDIFVAEGDTLNGWQASTRLTITPEKDEAPNIVVIKDTVWVVWQRVFEAGDSIMFANIYCRYYDGTNWSAELSLTNDSTFNLYPKINSRYNHPIVVWEKNQNIFYREYVNGNWQTSQQITADTFPDKFPEIAVCLYPFDYETYGVWITWQRDSVGNWDIYSTKYDTLNSYDRITSGGFDNRSASPLWFLRFVGRGGPTCTAFTTNRNGNDDIYYYQAYYGGGGYTGYVDLSAATDINPVMTEDGWIWILWQTDRNGEWDIYGSCISHGDIQEYQRLNNVQSEIRLEVFPNPFKNATAIKLQFPDSKTQKSLNIYDATGRLVRIFPVSTCYSLFYSVIWHGDDDLGHALPSGVYFIGLENEGMTVVEKVILLR